MRRHVLTLTRLFAVSIAGATSAVAGGPMLEAGKFTSSPKTPIMPLSRPLCVAAGPGFGHLTDELTGGVRFHTGLDFSAAFGADVRAAAPGRVSAAERRGPYGVFIEIDHGQGHRTRYGQLQMILVRPDDIVRKGDLIGRVGSSGRSSAPHLHFEVIRDGFASDPVPHFGDDPYCNAALPERTDATHRVRTDQPAPRTAAPAERLHTTDFAWPLCGSTNAGFGYRVDPFTGRTAFHAGLDLGAPAGLPIRASAKGRVMAAEERGPYGNMIEIDHGRGYRTRYGQLQSYRVSPGQLVSRGQVIGEVGSTGRSTGPHLHFELWHMNVVRDPLKHLERDCGRRR